MFLDCGRREACERGKEAAFDGLAPGVHCWAPAGEVEVFDDLGYGAHGVDVCCLVMDLGGRWSCDVGGDLHWVHGRCP